MAYEVVFVDWDGTLSTSRFWGHWTNEPKKASHYGRIQRDFFLAQPNVLEAWMRGQYDAESIVRQIATDTGLEPDLLMTGLRESCVQMEVDARALELLGRLREQGTKTVIATDNMDTFTRWTVPALGLTDYCDEVLNSHSLRALKKDKRANGTSAFFADYFKRTNNNPARTLLIDDSPRNAVVEDFGMRFSRVSPDAPVASILETLLKT